MRPDLRITSEDEVVTTSTNHKQKNMANHPFQWHIITGSNICDKAYPYICFSRLRGLDKMLCPNIDSAIAQRDNLNNLEQWATRYPPSVVKETELDAYSEEFLNGLCPLKS